MAIDEHHRHALHEAARRAFGDDAATTLMEMLPPVGWADVATKRDLDHVEALLRGEISALRSEMVGHVAQLRGEVSQASSRIILWIVPVIIAAFAASTAINLA